MSLESVFKLSLVMNMVDNLSGPMADVASRVGADVSKLDALSNTFGGMVKAGAVMQETGSQITGAVLAPVEATFETRRAIGELASLGVKDLEAVEDAARSFSDQWAGTTKADFISAAYDIKSGIASLSDEGIAQFTELAGLTAKATKSSVGEMTSLFATGYGIYKGYYDDLSDLEFGEMFSAGIARSVQQFKTDGSQMAGAIQTLGASATTANVPLEEQLSILGMLQATMGGSEAGTKYKAFLQSAAKAGDALGLSFVDANNQLLSMPEILDALRGKFGDTMDAAEKMELQKAFGTSEAVALIDLLYDKTDDLQGNILDMYDALDSGASVATGMANAINETEPERYERLNQRIQNVKESIGNMLLPTVNDLMGVGEAILSKTASWIEQNQELVKVIMLIVLGLGGFLTVGGAVITVVGGVGLVITKAVTAFKILKAGFGIAKAAMGPLISSVWSFTAALLANPVTWVVIGIVALIAAIVLLYNKCEWFRNLVNNILSFFREKLGAALDTAKAVFAGIGNIIGSVMGAARDTVAEKLDNMRAAYEAHGGGIRGAAAAAIEGVKGIFTAGYTFLDNLTGGKLTEIKNKFLEKLSPITGAVGSILGAARDTVAEKLDNMRAAYEAHGGGIRGAAAAAIEGVKEYYTAGFTFLDKLTDGKLSAIKDKFLEKLSPITGAVDSILSAAHDTAAEKLDNMRAAYEAHGGGIRGAAAAAIEGVKGTFTAGYTFLDNLTDGKLSAIKDKFSERMSSLTGVVSSSMSAAHDAAVQNLSNMQAAYEAHGGGIQGAAAAAMTGVRGTFEVGYTFLNNLTGGRLGEIRGKFVDGVSSIASGVRERFESVRSAFTSGLATIQPTISGAVTWFFESGKKVVSTFADGIRSAFSGAVDAVKGGLQRIRNMLPFSDAKEGPLSTLTLSGQRTMTTYASGLEQASNTPAQAIEKGLGMANKVLEKTPLAPVIDFARDKIAQVTGTDEDRPKASIEQEPPKKVDLSTTGSKDKDGESKGSDEGNGSKQIIIQKVLIPVDLKKIKDLQGLLALLQEVEDFANANGEDPEPAATTT